MADPIGACIMEIPMCAEEVFVILFIVQCRILLLLFWGKQVEAADSVDIDLGENWETAESDPSE